MNQVFVTGPFDQLGCRQVRLLQEASRLGPLTVLLWSDHSIQTITGQASRFPAGERRYILDRIRYVSSVMVIDMQDPDHLPSVDLPGPLTWAVTVDQYKDRKRRFCQKNGIRLAIIKDAMLEGLPLPEPIIETNRPKVVVTGCYDWLHSGHVRFFEQASEYGNLFVIVGNDENVRLLKGPGHPMFSQEQRQYMVSAVRYVAQAMISTGSGWLDADPQIRQIRPDIYIVNEDGDKGGKREYCQALGIRYVVLSRTPAPGLPRRTSTELRGF